MFRRKQKEQLRLCPYKYDLGQEVYFKWEERTGRAYYEKETRVSHGYVDSINLCMRSGSIQVTYNMKYYDKSGSPHYELVEEKDTYLTREELINSLSCSDICDMFNENTKRMETVNE